MLLELYKKLILLGIVIGPIFWLVFTDDGQRRSDSVFLWLKGENSIEFNLKELDAALTETELKTVYPDITWQCETRETSFGDRLCLTLIGTFNGIPAKYLTLFFADQRISALKLIYHPGYHKQLQGQLLQQLGDAEDESRAAVTAPAPESIVRWRTNHGEVVVKRKLTEDEEAALFWLSPSRLMSYRQPDS
ncbi:MAG: hypothetical protein DIZ78_02350 [endosymbiont of Escarpia spicata]|uniref:Uncharacterized protein n=1 Tax=endosymbiont of Escarpia spicata TaxID=2200908 RepID=A0A370DSJ0_9GAMM|nr:MAG: hypothetical protein DIZ78_02350 [endosymbiont of Escarpia spicata]